MKYLIIFLLLLIPLPASAATEYFGNFTVAGNNDELNANQILCTLFTSPSDAGTLTSLSIYFPVAGGNSMKMLIYSNTGTFLAASAGTAISSVGWATTTVSAVLSPSTQYCLGAIYQTNGTNIQYDHSNTGASELSNGTTYASPGNVTYTSVPNYGMTIYAAYTPTSVAYIPNTEICLSLYCFFK